MKIKLLLLSLFLPQMLFAAAVTNVQSLANFGLVSTMSQTDLVAIEINLHPRGMTRSNFISGLATTVYTSNTVWLSKNGSDGTGLRGDFAHPFLTPTGAVNAARAGDTIMVLPGTYGVKTVLFTVGTLLLRTNINWHFFSGAKITNDSASAYAIFDDSQNSSPAGVGKVYITGDGEFVDDYSGSAVRVGIAGSDVDMTFRKMSDHVNVSAGRLTLRNGTVEGTTSADNACLTVQGASSTSILDHVYLHYTNNDASGRTIRIRNGNTHTIIRDSVLDAGPAATNSVVPDTTGTVTVYGLVSMNITNNAGVTFTTGLYQPPLVSSSSFANGTTVDNTIVTNGVTDIQTNMDATATTNQVDFGTGPQSYFWTNMVTNVVCQLTNVWGGGISNRTYKFEFEGGALDYTVTFLVPNPGGVVLHWGVFVPTNGLTSFTVTNGHSASASLTLWNTNRIEAFYSPGI